MTIKDVSRFKGPPYDNTIFKSGDGVGLTYTNWDANSLTACDCDGGFFGADCSLGTCAALLHNFSASTATYACCMIIGMCE